MPTSFQTFNPGDVILDTHVEQYIEPIQKLEMGKPWYGQATGAVNAYAVTLDPVPAAYTAGMIVHFKANAATTGATTLNVNGLGAKSLLKQGSSSLATGDILSGQVMAAIYDGTNFQLLSPAVNPSVASLPTQNVLVYAETTKEQSSPTLTSLVLPSYNFNAAKTYLLEVTSVSDSSSGNQIQVVLAGSSTYTYPGSSTYLKAREDYRGITVHKLLPNLSGSHTITVKASYSSNVVVQIYEVYDNLVYADFAPAVTTSTITASTLAGFTAVSGHKYLMSVTATGFSSSIPAVSAYVTNGVNNVGLPYPDPTTDLQSGPTFAGAWTTHKLLTGLSGAYNVMTRSRYCGGVSVAIRDVT